MNYSDSVAQEDKSGRTLLTIKRVFCYIILIIVAVISMLPFWILIVNATRSHYQITGSFSLIPGTALLANLKSVFTNKNLPVASALVNSVFIAACVCVLTTYFSTMTAYGVHAYSFKLKKLAYVFILMILMIPAQVSAAGFVKEMSIFKWNDTFIPLILPAIAAPAVVFFMKQYMEGALPLEIVEAARIDGGNEFFNFNAIVLPIMKPAMAVQAIFAFVTTWNNYFMPAMILTSDKKKTVPIIIATMRGADYMNMDMGQIYMLLALAVVPLIIVYLCLSKFIIRGIALGSVKG